MRKGAMTGLALAAVVAVLSPLCHGQNYVDQQALLAAQQESLRTDAQLNQTYHTVITALDPAGQTALKSMQRSWVAFKEADFGIYARLAHMANADLDFYDYQNSENEDQSNALDELGKSGRGADVAFNSKTITNSQEADQFLNTIYHQVITALPPDVAPLEKTAQGSWIKFRDLYCQADTSMKGGVADDAVLRDLTVRRTAQLARYLKVLLKMQLPVSPTDHAYGETGEKALDLPMADLFRFAH